jgi:hypothetical protein
VSGADGQLGGQDVQGRHQPRLRHRAPRRQLFHRFPITNIYAVPLQIIHLRTSCGCGTASPSTRLLQPREVGTSDVTMDGCRFTGPKSIHVRVTVGPDYTSTADLHVAANSRADVVFNPGQVTFGVVPQGGTPTQAIEVEYAGALDWRVTGALTNGAPYDVTLAEMYRRPGQVGYRARFTLQAKAPTGALKHEAFLQTNDSASQLVPVLVEATVQAALTASPDTLTVPDLPVGQELTRKVMVRGARPFRILSVDGGGDGVSVASPLPSPQPQVQHALLLRCQPDKAGDFRRELKVKTDLQDLPLPVTVEGKAIQ